MGRALTVMVFRRCALGLVLTLTASLVACAPARLEVAPDVLAAAPPELLTRVRADVYNYFRLINREWTARTCEIFAADLPHEPVVQLHGDAHVEQYAFMNGTWGLDDFDDAARGPALVDIVRFLGSVDLTARERGWSRHRDDLFERFFAGYRRGLSDPAYEPPEPDVVRRQRAASPAMSRDEFVAWAEAQTSPVDDATMNNVIAGMKVFGTVLRSEHPDLDPGYFRVVRAGWLHMGVGSAGTLKILMRVAGPSSDAADDVVLEAKVVRSRGLLSCIDEPSSTPTLRIVQGSQRVGRLKHEILVAGPELAIPELTVRGQHLRNWWVRNWDASYHEIARRDLLSVRDLGEIAYDSGVQLGAGTLSAVAPPDDAALRARLMQWIDRSEPRLRQTAGRLVEELLAGWQDIEGQISRARDR